MALSKSTLPSIAPSVAIPYDTLQAFALAQTRTTSGYASNVNTQVQQGPGRYYGLWALDVSAADVSSGDEFYQFFLLGSNDAAFANGNVEVLQMHDIAATAALRDLATICAVSPAVPDTGIAGSVFAKPWCNQVDQYVFQYLQLYVSIGGTTPSVTFSSWLCPLSNC